MSEPLPYNVVPEPAMIARLRDRLAALDGREQALAEEINIARSALTRLLAGLPIRRGTFALVERYLAKGGA